VPEENHDSKISATQMADLPVAMNDSAMGGSKHFATETSSGDNVSLTTGDVLADRYEIIALIGRGGMGEVYSAMDNVRAEEVALKVLLPSFENNPQICERFRVEGRVASSFSHPHIVRVFDLQRSAGRTFMSMELLRGATLRDEMNRRFAKQSKFDDDELLSLLSQLTDAFSQIHPQHIHRDIKPENIWCCADGSYKVMDFGIARDTQAERVSQIGQGSGTLYYIPPEQQLGLADLDGRADQFSVGVTLYEMAVGVLPQGAARPPVEGNDSISPAMSDAIMRAIQMDPDERFETMPEFLAAADASNARSKRRLSLRSRTPRAERPPRQQRIPTIRPMTFTVAGMIGAWLSAVVGWYGAIAISPWVILLTGSAAAFCGLLALMGGINDKQPAATWHGVAHMAFGLIGLLAVLMMAVSHVDPSSWRLGFGMLGLVHLTATGPGTILSGFRAGLVRPIRNPVTSSSSNADPV